MGPFGQRGQLLLQDPLGMPEDPPGLLKRNLINVTVRNEVIYLLTLIKDKSTSIVLEAVTEGT